MGVGHRGMKGGDGMVHKAIPDTGKDVKTNGRIKSFDGSNNTNEWRTSLCLV